MTAIGDITTFPSGETKSIVLLAPATATNSPPSGSSAGLATADIYGLFSYMPTSVTLQVYSTAGSGTMTVTIRLWGYLDNATGTGKWHPIGPGGDSTKGIIDLQSAIGEDQADVITHTETIDLPGHFRRLYAEVTAIGGTGTSITVELVARRSYP